MNELALKVENISKEYRLGTIGGATLKGELQSKIAKLHHQDDPNLKIGEKSYKKNERFLALNDISFEIKKGERVGILGHNGAGKSTLLKLICRVTTPTTGNIYINGRITSMLEVGTGFHGELTGRENIYLNGAILGMSKEEINRRYNEIVDFSEVGKFIDTPIKRYSSGMKVKLGFSIASHLDSEIMIMDEVLAVGDVSFQNKCINRMKVVAEEEDRTILYVSHNMATVKALCDRCIVLNKGKVVFDGDTEEAISIYLHNNIDEDGTFFDTSMLPRHKKCNKRHIIQSLQILNKDNNITLYGEIFKFKLVWLSQNDDEPVKMKMVINGIDGTPVGVAFAGGLRHKTGINKNEFTFDTSYLVPGHYSADFILYNEDSLGNVIFYDRCNALRFKIEHSAESIKLRHWFKDWGNAVLPCVEPVGENLNTSMDSFDN